MASKQNIDIPVFNIQNQKEFEHRALEIFQYQSANNEVYHQYLNLIHVEPQKVKSLHRIPFLPIEFFKTKVVKTGNFNPELIFRSSGTTGQNTSRHFIKDLQLYRNSFLKAFELFYGPIRNYCVLALLPSYLEREGSSLINMVEELIKLSKHPDSGFYLYDLDKLAITIKKLEKKQQKTILFGVSFALLDFAEKYSMPLKHTTIIETGGMKGRRKEMIRKELHEVLSGAFHSENMHSEYGMTELLSQAYSLNNGIFKTPPWMQVYMRDPYDPFTILPEGRSGGINIIDLANQHSCSFIETQDIGKKINSQEFLVMGRIDQSDIRGCNLLVY